MKNKTIYVLAVSLLVLVSAALAQIQIPNLSPPQAPPESTAVAAPPGAQAASPTPTPR